MDKNRLEIQHLTAADYRRPSYIACGSLYGERGGEIIRDAAIAALRRLRGCEEISKTGCRGAKDPDIATRRQPDFRIGSQPRSRRSNVRFKGDATDD